MFLKHKTYAMDSWGKCQKGHSVEKKKRGKKKIRNGDVCGAPAWLCQVAAMHWVFFAFLAPRPVRSSVCPHPPPVRGPRSLSSR